MNSNEKQIVLAYLDARLAQVSDDIEILKNSEDLYASGGHLRLTDARHAFVSLAREREAFEALPAYEIEPRHGGKRVLFGRIADGFPPVPTPSDLVGTMAREAGGFPRQGSRVAPVADVGTRRSEARKNVVGFPNRKREGSPDGQAFRNARLAARDRLNGSWPDASTG